MDRFTFRIKIRAMTLISVIVLITIGLSSLVLSRLASTTIQERASDQFTWNTKQVTHHVQTSLNNYNSVLYMSRSYVVNTPGLSQTQWNGFFRNQDIFGQYKGLNSVSYIQLVPEAQKDSFVAEKRRSPDFGSSFTVSPAGTRDIYGLATLSVSRNNLAMTGFDVYSTPDRRIAYQSALATGQPTVSRQIVLNSNVTGFFVALPVVVAGDRSTFATVAIHTDSFFADIIAHSELDKMAVQVSDVTDPANPDVLYTSTTWSKNDFDLAKTDKINFGGRIWQLSYHSQLPYIQQVTAHFIPYLVLIAGALLASTILLTIYIFTKTTPRHRH